MSQEARTPLTAEEHKKELLDLCRELLEFEHLFSFQNKETGKADADNDFLAFMRHLEKKHRAVHTAWKSLQASLLTECARLNTLPAHRGGLTATTQLFRGLYGIDAPGMPTQSSGIAQGHADLALFNLLSTLPSFVPLFTGALHTLKQVSNELSRFRQSLFAQKLLALLDSMPVLFADKAAFLRVLDTPHFRGPMQVDLGYETILHTLFHQPEYRLGFSEIAHLIINPHISQVNKIPLIQALLDKHPRLTGYISEPLTWQTLTDMRGRIAKDSAAIEARFKTATAFVTELGPQQAWRGFELVMAPLAMEKRCLRKKHQEQAVKKLTEKFRQLCASHPHAAAIHKARPKLYGLHLNTVPPGIKPAYLAIQQAAQAVYTTQSHEQYRTHSRIETYYNRMHAWIIQSQHDQATLSATLIKVYTHNPRLIDQAKAALSVNRQLATNLFALLTDMPIIHEAKKAEHLSYAVSFRGPRQAELDYEEVLVALTTQPELTRSFTEICANAKTPSIPQVAVIEKISQLLADNPTLTRYLALPRTQASLDKMKRNIATDSATIEANIALATQYVDLVGNEKAFDDFDGYFNSLVGADKEQTSDYYHRVSDILEKLEEREPDLHEGIILVFAHNQDLMIRITKPALEAEEKKRAEAARPAAAAALAAPMPPPLPAEYRSPPCALSLHAERHPEEERKVAEAAAVAALAALMPRPASSHKQPTSAMHAKRPIDKTTPNYQSDAKKRHAKDKDTEKRSAGQKRPSTWNPRVLKQNSPEKRRAGRTVSPVPSRENQQGPR